MPKAIQASSVAVGEDVDDPEHEADRGQPEVAEDQQRPDLPTRPRLAHASAAKPLCQEHEAPACGDDPGDECGPFHLGAPFFAIGTLRANAKDFLNTEC